MKLKYCGPKPVISEHGISFKDGKEDKYVYIQDAIELFISLNHNYEKGKIYKKDISKEPLDDEKIENIILKFKPELKETIQREISSYKNHLNQEIENLTQTHPLLENLELIAFKNNLKIMFDYKIQRAINKIYYMHIIEIISDTIKKEKIKDIITPFNEKFWHILQTLQGHLSNTKDYINTKLKENENSTLELSIDII